MPESLNYRRQQTQVFLVLERLVRLVEKRMAALFKSEGLADVTPAQANALVIMFEQRSPMKARKLAELMALSEVTVGRFMHSLEKGGWITRERDAHDSRAVLVRPTKKAYAALPRFIKVADRMLDEGLADLSRKDVSRLAVVLDQVHHALIAAGKATPAAKSRPPSRR